jgi:hypothetical protein
MRSRLRGRVMTIWLLISGAGAAVAYCSDVPKDEFIAIAIGASKVSDLERFRATTIDMNQARTAYAKSILTFADSVERIRPSTQLPKTDDSRVAVAKTQASEIEAKFYQRKVPVQEAIDAWFSFAKQFSDPFVVQEALLRAGKLSSLSRDKKVRAEARNLFERVIASPGGLTPWKVRARQALASESSNVTDRYNARRDCLIELIALSKGQREEVEHLLKWDGDEANFDYCKRVIEVAEAIADAKTSLKRSLLLDARKTMNASSLGQLEQLFTSDSETIVNLNLVSFKGVGATGGWRGRSLSLLTNAAIMVGIISLLVARKVRKGRTNASEPDAGRVVNDIVGAVGQE